MADLLAKSINAPGGRLAEILLKKLFKPEGGREMTDHVRARLEKLVHADGQFGVLARVRLAMDVAFLFDIAPDWTAANIVPLFDWSSPYAHATWSSLKYSSYIGSPTLIGLMKKPFLTLFGRDDLDREDLRTFSGWLAAMMVANKEGDISYPITPTEARSALREVGSEGLSSVAHRLAVEMEKAEPDGKIDKWRNVVGPVFRSIWPLDAELQSPAMTFKLVQILRGSGPAFSEAADMIIPFIRPEDPRRQTTIFTISDAPHVLYSSSPSKMLDLISAVVGEAPPKSVYGLSKALDQVCAVDPTLADTKKFQKLISSAGVN